MKRHLITTADERSWKFDRPVLFLGEWCRRYDRKHVWSKMDAIVTEAYGLAPEQKLHNNNYVITLAETILTTLAEALNRFHQTRHSERYWNIVLGHWLQRYVSVAFDRYYALEGAVRSHAISGTTVVEGSEYSLATGDSDSFTWACNDDSWNEVLFSRLIAYRGDIEVGTEYSRSLKGSFDNRARGVGGRKVRFVDLTRNLVKKVVPYLAKDTDAFIINSYLPKWVAIKLQLALGQAPQIWQSPTFSHARPDRSARANLGLGYDQYEGFERYVRWQLPSLIPTCYLEGYGALVKKVATLPWPKRPKFIFTSNNFDTDEIFKLWTGAMIESGVPYYVGQHGGYQPNFARPRLPEIVTSDKFFTWGWAGERANNLPAFIFKTAGSKFGDFDPQGGLLLVEQPLPHRLGPHFYFGSEYYEYEAYLEDQFRFVRMLPTRIQRQLTVRLHATYERLASSDRRRWEDRSPNTRLDTGTTPIRKLTAQSRLVVHSYDSTGIRETLSLNIPTICFWRGSSNHLLTCARPYYELLRTAGILADSPEEAVKMVSSRWDDVVAWWKSAQVQRARELFCAKYARTVKNPVKTMKTLLLERTNQLLGSR